jgi:hypothetical protein
MLVKFWLILHKKYDPMVRFQVVLCYGDCEYPDRPSNLVFFLEFYKSDRDSSSKDKDENKEEDIPVPNVTLAGDISNERLIFSEEDAKA